MWPKEEHGFFMHPPLLKSTSVRRRENRYKGEAEGDINVDTKGLHKCPIRHQFGHH
jgi:hypothetical protein